MKNWLQLQQGYRTRMTVSRGLYILTAVILVASTVVMQLISREAIIGLLVGAFLGLLPFVIAQSLAVTAGKRFGVPYNRRTNEYIQLEEQGLLYAFHPVESDNPEEMITYSIPYAAIRRIMFDTQTGILNLVGEGKIRIYEDLLITRLAADGEGRRLYVDSAYQIMLAHKEAEKIVNTLKQKNKGE